MSDFFCFLFILGNISRPKRPFVTTSRQFTNSYFAVMLVTWYFITEIQWRTTIDNMKPTQSHLSVIIVENNWKRRNHWKFTARLVVGRRVNAVHIATRLLSGIIATADMLIKSRVKHRKILQTEPARCPFSWLQNARGYNWTKERIIDDRIVMYKLSKNDIRMFQYMNKKVQLNQFCFYVYEACMCNEFFFIVAPFPGIKHIISRYFNCEPRNTSVQ